MARHQYLQHFEKIGPGGVVQLEVEVGKEKKERGKLRLGLQRP